MKQEYGDVGPRPGWAVSDKPGSFRAYVDWLNRLARASFLNDGNHPEMFFFVGEEGALSGAQFPEGTASDQKNEVIMRGAEDLHPFGTVRVRIVNANRINPDGSVSNALQRCLWMNSETRLGTKVVLASPIEEANEGWSLGDTMILQESG